MPCLGPGLSLDEPSEPAMRKITFSLPDPYIETLDAIAEQAQCDRAVIVRQAIEQYVEDFEDLSISTKRLQDPSDPVLSWGEVKNNLLG